MANRLILLSALLVGVTGFLIVRASGVHDGGIFETRADTVVVLAGEFQPRARDGRGSVAILRVPDGRMVARLSGFSTAAEGDLRLYLIGATDARNAAELERVGFLDLGQLRPGRAEQYYVIPPNTPLSRVRAIVVWERGANLNVSTAELRRP